MSFKGKERKSDMIERKALLKQINSRKRKLNSVRRQLKSHFVGLDRIIDKVISSIEVWYVMPEIMTRPLIVNLWGMTGVGKTDLVRRLVRGLDLSNNFLEVQLNNKGVALTREGKLTEAIELFDKAADAMPANRVININAAKGLILFMQKSGPTSDYLTKTKKYLDRIRKLEPNNPTLKQLQTAFVKIVEAAGSN